jgi:uncharacterized protein (DUF1015 family)
LVTIDPMARALVAVDSAAADALGAPNYDEFQSDVEVWERIHARPSCVLRVTMPHCDVAAPAAILEAESDAALERARANMAELAASPLTREVEDAFWVYEIRSAGPAGSRQIGLGGMARTAEIRTPANPHGPIIRNEGVREKKARGRAELTEATRADMGTVNCAVDDTGGELEAALEAYATSLPPDLETVDEAGNRHRVWLVTKPMAVELLRAVLAGEPRAYVADGNHRSAAAAMLGMPRFLAVFFPARMMRIEPYNRLVTRAVPAPGDLRAALEVSFEVTRYEGTGAFQPRATHEIGLYDGRTWWRLRPRPGTFDPADAAQDIDADIVQRRLFAGVLGVGDARDERLTFVGANRDAAWLQAEVDAGRFRYAVTLPPVTMAQFSRVCRQDRLMPPKSTWFEPKIRSGLVMALLET